MRAIGSRFFAFTGCILVASMGLALGKPDTLTTERKLREVFLPRFSLDVVSLKEAVRELEDQIRAAGAAKDVIIRVTPSPSREESQVNLSYKFDLRDVMLEDALRKVCDLAATSYKVEDGEVVILPFGSSGEKPAAPDAEPAWASKLDLVIPSLEWSEVDPRDAIVRLRQISQELDSVKPGGIQFVLRQPLPDPAARISLTLKNVTIRKALDAYVEKAGLKWKTTESGVLIYP